MGRLADGQAPHAMLAHIKSHMFDEDQTRLLIFNHARKALPPARLPMRESPHEYGTVRGARGNSRPYRDILLLRCMSPFVACAVKRRRFSSGCKPHPATAPAGSNRSSHGGNEVAEAFG
jgi:hypothetical protein